MRFGEFCAITRAMVIRAYVLVLHRYPANDVTKHIQSPDKSQVEQHYLKINVWIVQDSHTNSEREKIFLKS